MAQYAPEDQDRRKRRRERNKVAAAKCRNKKKEKTDGLQQVERAEPTVEFCLLYGPAWKQ